MPVTVNSNVTFNPSTGAAAAGAGTGSPLPAVASMAVQAGSASASGVPLRSQVGASALVAKGTGVPLTAAVSGNPLVPAVGTTFWGAYVSGKTTAAAWETWETSIAGRTMDVVQVYHDDTVTGPQSWEQTLCGTGTGRHLMFSNDLRNYSSGVHMACTDITSGVYDTYFTTLANNFASWGVPCWYVFQHEMDNSTNRVMWQIGTNSGTNTSGASNFIAAWQYVHAIFQTQGATMVQWVWCVTGSNTALDLALWPGNAYVDAIGWDPYTHSTWSLPTALFSSFPSWLSSVSGTISNSIPQFICETGVNNVAFTTPPQDYATWWEAVPAGCSANGLSAIVAFDSTGGYNTLIDGTPGEVTAYQIAGADSNVNQ